MFLEKSISDSTLCEAVLASVLSDGVKAPVGLDSTSPFSQLTGEFYHLHFICSSDRSSSSSNLQSTYVCRQSICLLKGSNLNHFDKPEAKSQSKSKSKSKSKPKSNPKKGKLVYRSKGGQRR